MARPLGGNETFLVVLVTGRGFRDNDLTGGKTLPPPFSVLIYVETPDGAHLRFFYKPGHTQLPD